MTAEEFIKQLEELRIITPRIALSNTKAVNSEFCNWAINNKNCYLIFASDHDEDCAYSRWLYYSKDTLDCNNMYEGTLCYECLDTNKSYNCNFCQDCDTCNNCDYCYNCIGCADCIGCVNQKRAKFKILNKQYAEKEYKTLKQKLESKDELKNIEDVFEQLKAENPRKSMHGKSNENCTGDYIYHSKNCYDSYDINDCEDCGYIIDGVNKIKDCYDIIALEDAQMCYEGMSNWGFNQTFCIMCWFSANMEYCEMCQSCSDCFGCVSLKSKKFHILNKKYEEAEYKEKVAEIKANLKAKNLYNRWFPVSTFRYEDTLAQDFYPM